MTKPRKAIKINPLVDKYCENYRDLCQEVRSFESFKYLHLGIISEIKRKSLPGIAKIVGLENSQNLHNLISEAEWSVERLRERLKKGDKYQSKPEIGGNIIKELREKGFKISLVLADSLYGESEPNFVSILNEEKLSFALAIRNNHGMWLPLGQRIRYNKWREYERVMTNGKEEIRYIREIIYGKKREIRYWQVTNDKETLPEASTWDIMTKIPNLKYQEVGNIYGFRNWIEYGFKQSKNELGWADFRVTEYSKIEKWWEIIMSAYLMISWQVKELKELEIAPNSNRNKPRKLKLKEVRKHPHWDQGKGWKDYLNNLRLFLQPLACFNLLKPWLIVLFSPRRIRAFAHLFFWLIRAINSLLETIFPSNSYFSSA